MQYFTLFFLSLHGQSDFWSSYFGELRLEEGIKNN